MQCSKDALIMLFFNLPSSLHLLFLFFYFSSVFLAKFFASISRKTTIFFQSINEAVLLQDEDGEGDNLGLFTFESTDVHESGEDRDLVADVICGGESLSFLRAKNDKDEIVDHGSIVEEEPIFEDPYELFVMEDQSPYHSSHASESGHQIMEDVIEEEEEERTQGDYKNSNHSLTMSTHQKVADHEDGEVVEPTRIDRDDQEDGLVATDDHTLISDQEETDNEVVDNNPNKENAVCEDPIIETNISLDGKFVILESKELQAYQKGHIDDDAEEIYGDSYTDGSTSKSSSEWRNSLNCRDSGTDDPFSSSSRRSCPTWESYSMFKKYDEEMIFFDRISAQKLNETESLKAVQVSPRSISQRIVHKLATTTTNKRSSDQLRRNPYQELESVYVAQVCLAWEALSWNYKSFKQLRASRRDIEDESASFCPARIAQQFQQFQVLLQRFNENEPFEHGRRPEIYARIRRSAPKLLQVPEFRDSEDYHNEVGEKAMISTAKFLKILEDAIRTFMNFLKADKEKLHSQIFKAIFKRNSRSSVDPTTLHLLKRTNRKKKKRLEDICRAQKCLRKKKLKEEEEMEILMSLIDLKLVSRVLRMSEISQQQVKWCEEKMSKVKVFERKVQRDSSPLSFPAQY